MRILRVLPTLGTIIFLMVGNAYSQKTAIHNSPEAIYRSALDLFDKEKFGSAQQLFDEVITRASNPSSQIQVNAEYYAAICAMELFHDDTEYRLETFIAHHPENSKVELAYFKLGCFNFRKKQYTKAIESFENIDIYDLKKDKLSEYYFKTGYSYFMIKNYESAKQNFYQVKDTDSEYAPIATYYFSHIAYTEKNYETALIGFQSLQNDENFKALVPYYITQIYYLQQRYDQLLKVAPPLLDSASTKRAPEIARLIGEAYYRTGKYAEATPYLEIYRDKSTSLPTREDNYQLGFCYYKAGNFEKALKSLVSVTSVDDSLAQNAHYLLAGCYIRSDQKRLALSSFSEACRLNFDKKIGENALFNYAKLSYELSYNPYNEAINSFQKFIADYPESDRVDEANTYLVNLYLSTKNYKDALASIEKIKFRDERLKMAYQKITYFRGVELFNDQLLRQAISLFSKSIKNPYDKSIAALCHYWKGEAYYRMAKYDSAIAEQKAFQLLPGAFSLPNYNMANYNLGYAYFEKKDYPASIVHFRKFVTNKSSEESRIINDAWLRLGDCYFVDKSYQSAIECYGNAIDMKVIDTDYAYYQKAICLGVLGKPGEKIATLQKIIDQYADSHYLDDAIYEQGNTWLLMQNNDKAIASFDKVMHEHPNSSFVKSSMLKTGLIYYNTKNDEKALITLKRVVSTYPGTAESKEALLAIRNIYMDIDKVDEFFVYVKELPFASVSSSEQDSITYMAAENRYMGGDCENSLQGFSNYLDKFPNGSFVINAIFYRGECYLRLNKYQEALADYKEIANRPKSKFTESAVLKSATLSFRLKQYSNALQYYSRLEDIAEYPANVMESRIGKMRCNYQLEDHYKIIESANKVLNTEKVSNEVIQEAHLAIGRSAMAVDSISLAQAQFTILSKLTNSEMGVEAKYNLALIQYNFENYTESEKIIWEIINSTPSYDYWLAKSFILLADNYVKIGNVYQAKHTLKSIIDGYDGADLIQTAQEKLNAIIEAEKLEEQKAADEKAEEAKKAEESGAIEETAVEEAMEEVETGNASPE